MMEFESAAQQRVERFEAEVNRILAVVGHPEALVTDESLIDDFSDFGQGFAEAELQRISHELGIRVQNGTLIADIAELLKKKKRL